MGLVLPHLAALVKNEKPFDPGDIRFLSSPSMMEQAEFRANSIEQHDGRFPCTLGARPLSKNHRAALELCEYSRAVRGMARSKMRGYDATRQPKSTWLIDVPAEARYSTARHGIITS
jgi:hypothetical protein